jgi:hypothetical protein
MSISSKLFIFFVSIFLGQKSLIAADNVGKNFLEYFSSTCPSQGDWTKLVISDAEALIEILKTLRDDADCVSSAGSIAQLGGLARKIADLENSKITQIEIEKLKAKEIELSNQLTNTQNTDTQQKLQDALNLVQVEKAMLQAELNSQNSVGANNVSKTYSQIVLSTNQLYKTISSNTLCLDKNPRLISSITSLVSSIGSAVSTVNPALGIGLAATSEFLGNTIEATRKGNINRKIRKISDNVLINSGYKCALESLSNRWCELTDARKLLEFKFNMKKVDSEENAFLEIVNLYDRKIPSFLEWLAKVRAGAPAATETDAIRHAIVYERWKQVQVASSRGDGVLTEYRSRYELLSDTQKQEKYNIIRQVIIKLTDVCTNNSSNVSSPLFDIYLKSYAPYRLLGLDAIPRTASDDAISFCDFNPFTQWPTGVYIPDYNKLNEEYKNWIKKTSVFVNTEFTQVLQPDALGVLSLAFERSGSKWKTSPKKSIDELIAFISKNKPDKFENFTFSKIYQEIETNLLSISDALNKSIITNELSPKDAINMIFEIANLQFGTVIFESRLEMVVRLSLDQYLKNLSLEERNIASQLLAMESYLDTLKKVSGKDTDELVMFDIQSAQKGALSNMRAFMEVFSKNINKHMKGLQKSIVKNSDTTQTAVDLEDLAKFCVLLSSMPNVVTEIDMKICYGKKIKALIKDGPETPILTQSYLNEDFANRSCIYRDYLRKSKIYREWDIKI